MIHVTTTKRIWMDILNSVINIKDECTFNFTKKSLNIREVDCTHVCIVNIVVDNKQFKRYGIRETVSNVIDVESFKKILNTKFINDSALVSLIIDDTKTITIRVDDFSECLLSHQMKFIEWENYSMPKMPSMSNTTEITLPLSTFANVLNYVMRTTNHVNFRISKDRSNIFTVDSTKLSDLIVSVDIPKVKYKIIKPDMISSIMDLEQLNPIIKNMVKVFEKDAMIKLKLGQDYPISITANKKGFDFTFMLAPRIESD